MNAILRRTSLLGILAVIAGVLTALRVNPVSGETYRLPGSAGPYLFGVNKVQPDGSKVTRYENWANERRLDGPTWTLYPGSAGLNVLAQQQGAWTMEL
jgi:hypothetical protein